MSTESYAERVSKALESTGLAEPRSASFGDNRIAILCRVQKDNEAKWVELVTKILTGADMSTQTASPWQCHICKHYFLKVVEGANKIVWGWNFSLHSKEMSTSLDTVIALLKGRPLTVVTNEIEEFPLIGSSSSRNMTSKNGKGVFTIGGGNDFHPGKK